MGLLDGALGDLTGRGRLVPAATGHGTAESGRWARRPGRQAVPGLIMGRLTGIGRRALPGLVAAGLSWTPAWAQSDSVPVDPREPPAAAVDLDAVAKRLQNYFTEEELRTLFDYMRDVSIAALQGKGDEVLLPPDLAFKMAILQERMMREGQFQMQLMMKQLERDIDRALKDLFKPLAPSAPPVVKPPEPQAVPAKPEALPAPARPANPYAPHLPAVREQPYRMGY